MLRVAGLSVLLLSLGAPAYQSVQRRAESVGNLGRFLERYVGDCDSDDPNFDRAQCEADAKAQRAEFQGRLIRLDFDDLRGQIKLVGWDARKNAYRLELTPFFSERGLGLSIGKPKRLTSDGLPVVRNIPIWVKGVGNEPEFVFRRQLDRGMVRLELLVKPKRAWRLKKGRHTVRGADVSLKGFRLYPSRGDTVLAELTY